MKKYITLILFSIAHTVYAQDSIYVRNDSLHTTSGFVVYPGQRLKLGIGNMPNGDFRYINVSTSSFYHITHRGHPGYESALSKRSTNQQVEVTRIDIRGNAKKGYVYYPIINAGSTSYQVDMEGAIATGEIVVPDEFKPGQVSARQTQEDAYDKLKKLKELLDAGAITQEEYDTQKKKLLEQP